MRPALARDLVGQRLSHEDGQQVAGLHRWEIGHRGRLSGGLEDPARLVGAELLGGGA
jgi:hypothetical protein